MSDVTARAEVDLSITVQLPSRWHSSVSHDDIRASAIEFVKNWFASMANEAARVSSTRPRWWLKASPKVTSVVAAETDHLKAEGQYAKTPPLEFSEFIPKSKFDGLVEQTKRLETLVREQQLQLAMVKTGADGVWRWVGDGTDNPATLSCPVIMSAEKLRELAADAAEAVTTRMEKAEAIALSCIFCGEVCSDISRLRDHSASCKDHPAVSELTETLITLEKTREASTILGTAAAQQLGVMNDEIQKLTQALEAEKRESLKLQMKLNSVTSL